MSPPPTGCDVLAFNPVLRAQPTTSQADAPSGLDFELKVPQSEAAGLPATPPLRNVSVAFPAGFSIGFRPRYPPHRGLPSVDDLAAMRRNYDLLQGQDDRVSSRVRCGDRGRTHLQQVFDPVSDSRSRTVGRASVFRARSLGPRGCARRVWDRVMCCVDALGWGLVD